MLDNILRDQIEAASNVLSLNPAAIEKDYHVTRVIHALSEVKNDYFQLVFAGGTCLAKGHRLVKRMSEDVDFKMQKNITHLNVSKSHYLKELKIFRDQLVKQLQGVDLQLGNIQPRNEGQYLRIELNYLSHFPKANALRPHLLLEFSASEIRLPTQVLPIAPLMIEVLADAHSLTTRPITCISVAETAAEKWVGLTRRVAAIERGYYEDDSTLVRHIYDLAAINIAKLADNRLYELGALIVMQDAKQYKNQYPEYHQNAVKEIEKSLCALKENPKWETNYQLFVESMVYDKSSLPNYIDALRQVEIIKNNIAPYIKQNSS